MIDWAEQYRANDRMIRGTARRFHPRVDTEEISQRVWEVAIALEPTFHGDGIKPWLLAITRNAVWAEINWWSRRRRHARIPWVASADAEQDSALEMEDARSMARKMLDGCTPSERAAVVAYYYEDLSYPEAAAALGISINTLKSNLALARRKMQARIALEMAHILPSSLGLSSQWPMAMEDRTAARTRRKRRKRKGQEWRLTVRRGATT